MEIREIKFTDYFFDFYEQLDLKKQEKIDFLIRVLETQAIIPQKYVKHISGSDGIYELRLSTAQNEYRILFFFEEGSLIEGGKIVVLGNGFVKKSNKDYVKPVQQAEEIKAKYLNDLKSNQED